MAGNPDVAARGAAYGMPGVRVDGNDVLAVYEAAGEAVRRARAGDGPTLLECLTYRTRAHAEGMRDAGYRTREEVEAWKARCPIARWRERLLATGAVAADDLDRIDHEVAGARRGGRRVRQGEPLAGSGDGDPHVYAEPREARDARADVHGAAREGLAEEMARDPSIFVVGEGIGARGGNFNTTAGLFDRYGAGAAARHADHRARLHRPLHRRGDDRRAARWWTTCSSTSSSTRSASCSTRPPRSST